MLHGLDWIRTVVGDGVLHDVKGGEVQEGMVDALVQKQLKCVEGQVSDVDMVSWKESEDKRDRGTGPKGRDGENEKVIERGR